MAGSSSMDISTASTRASMGYAGGGAKANFAKTKLGKKLGIGRKKKKKAGDGQGDDVLDELLEAILSADWGGLQKYLNTKEGKADFKKNLEVIGYDSSLNTNSSDYSFVSGMTELQHNMSRRSLLMDATPTHTAPSPSSFLLLGDSGGGATVASEAPSDSSDSKKGSKDGKTKNKNGTPTGAPPDRNPLHNKATPTLLHLVCTLNPPIQLVEKIVWSKPEMINVLNVSNQSALHLAAAWGASPEVITCLLCQNPLNLASSKDSRQKTPLHYACECGPSQYGQYAEDNDENFLCQVVEALGKYYPEAAKAVDSAGFTPLQYAKKHKASKATIQALRLLTEK
jgi:hypothetical protein